MSESSPESAFTPVSPANLISNESYLETVTDFMVPLETRLTKAQMEGMRRGSMAAHLVTESAHNEQLREINRQVEYWMKKATTDELTGLPNRLALLNRLDVLVADEPGEFALAFVDLDGLKDVNDSKGHEAGNILIRTAAEAMSVSIRTHDTPGYSRRAHDIEGRAAVRLSGDEFILVIDKINDPTLLESVIERVRSCLDTNDVRASFGAAIHQPGQSGLDLLKEVDEKMYVNKTQRRKQRQLVELAALPVAVRNRLYEIKVELDEMQVGIAGLNRLHGESSR